jgi:Tol biopolymer transport system component
MMTHEVLRVMRKLSRIVLAAMLMLPLSGSVAAQSTSEDEDIAPRATLPMGRLVFSSDRVDRDLDLWVIEAGSSEAVRLTTAEGSDRTPAFSPAGGAVAFASARDNLGGINAQGSNLRYYDLFVISSDGPVVKELFANDHFNHGPAWSPDGSTIAFYGEKNLGGIQVMQIFVMAADGSAKPTALTEDPVGASSPEWSPDSSRIAFTSLRHGQNADESWNREIYVMDPDGENETRLTEHPAKDASPAWAPDGTSIAFSSDRAGNDDIYVMDTSGGEPVRLRQL